MAERPPAVGRGVVMVSSDYAPEVIGGAERQCQKLAAALVRRGIPVTVLTSARRPAGGTACTDGVQIVRFPTRASPQLGGRHLATSVAWGRRVGGWIAAHRTQVAVVHAHQAKLNAYWAVRAAGRWGLPTVVKVGLAGPSFDLRSLARKRYLYGRLAARTVATGATRMVAISADIAADLAAAGVGDRRICRIPNGVDVAGSGPVTADERRRARAGLHLDPEATVLVYTGRLARQKNLASLVDAFDRAAPERSDVILVLVGSGDQRGPLEADVAHRRLGDRVRFVGPVDDVGAWLRSADAFVLPSAAEGLSNSLLEAMSLGLAPIASAVSGSTEVIDDGASGLLFDPAEPGDLARVLGRFLEAGAAQRAAWGAAAYATVAGAYDIDAVAGRYQELYCLLETEHRRP